MGFFDFVKSKNSNELSLEEQLSNNLLPNEMQAIMYNEVRRLKQYGDQLARSQSQEDALEFQQIILQAFEPVTTIYDWLKDRGIHELNGIVLLASFYLVNLSDVTFKDPHKFSDYEITNVINTFLAGMGAAGQVDTSSYNGLVRVGISWLLSHPTN